MMYEQERKPEAKAVPEGERRREMMGTREEMMGTVTPMMRGGIMPAWYSRISWGAVFAGVLIAIAAELLLSAIGILIGFGTANVTSVAALRNVTVAVGIWTSISAIIALYIGGLVASRLGVVQFTSDGIWHGITVWAVALVLGVLFSVFGVSGLLSFVSNVVGALRGIIPAGTQISPGDLRTAADIVTTSTAFFLAGAILSLGAAILGGWLGSQRMSRAQAMREAAMPERKAAA
ncbi:MAG: hypothetical protein AB1743_06650 [Actinomycetota bacterium]